VARQIYAGEVGSVPDMSIIRREVGFVERAGRWGRHRSWRRDELLRSETPVPESKFLSYRLNRSIRAALIATAATQRFHWSIPGCVGREVRPKYGLFEMIIFADCAVFYPTGWSQLCSLGAQPRHPVSGRSVLSETIGAPRRAASPSYLRCPYRAWRPPPRCFGRSPRRFCLRPRRNSCCLAVAAATTAPHLWSFAVTGITWLQGPEKLSTITAPAMKSSTRGTVVLCWPCASNICGTSLLAVYPSRRGESQNSSGSVVGPAVGFPQLVRLAAYLRGRVRNPAMRYGVVFFPFGVASVRSASSEVFRPSSCPSSPAGHECRTGRRSRQPPGS